MNFISIDVETANADMSSICQIGIAEFKDGVFVKGWKSYVNPEDYFDQMNISIHGIDEITVTEAPRFPDITEIISEYFISHICVCHTHFDRVSIIKAFEKYEIEPPVIKWLDSALVARRTWEQFAYKGYGLKNICDFIGYNFTHHDAFEDAKASGHIMIAAIEKTGLDIESWLKRVRQPINISKSSDSHHIKMNGNPDGPLYGEVMVFTGALSIHRNEAVIMAANLGCQVENSVTKRTTLLVAGDQDIKKLAGQEKSTKHRKAEELMLQGQQIRILKESDFKALASLS
ncbi:MAG: exonuclease domain-containing protein [Dehalococcoidales bacterium]|jgi:DNA polymerase-3 subunit epsilon